MSQKSRKVTLNKQKVAQARNSRTKQKMRQNRITKVAVKRKANNVRAAKRMFYQNAIARNDANLFKFLHEMDKEGFTADDKVNLEESIGDIIRTGIFAANRMQFMSAVGLDKFNISKEEHTEFENAILTVFTKLEPFTKEGFEITVDMIDDLSDITSSLVTLQTKMEEMTNPQYIEEHKEAFEELEEYVKGLLDVWKERGHTEADFNKVIFMRYMAALMEAKEEQENELVES